MLRSELFALKWSDIDSTDRTINIARSIYGQVEFLRELYTGSYFYHARDITSAAAPSEVLEERLADAAETVFAQQIGSESGEEFIAPDKKEDDPIALEDPSYEAAVLNRKIRSAGA